MSEEISSQDRNIRGFFYFFLLVIFIHYGFNFTASPLTLYSYYIIALISAFAAFFLPFRHSVCFLFFLLVFEGQGRILSGYHPLFRIIFDLLLGVAIVKNLAKNKIILPQKRLPPILTWLFVLHFAWWIIELANPMGAPVWAAIATSKYYVFPILLFCAMTSGDIRVESEYFQRYIFWFFIVLFIGIVLCGFQLQYGADFMHSISPYYSFLFKKFENFGGKFFRPWGTTHYPGGFSTILYISIGLIFLFREASDRAIQISKRKVRIRYLIYIIFVMAVWYTMLISQVRANFIKSIMIILGCGIVKIWAAKEKSKTIVTIFVGTILAAAISSFFLFNLTDYAEKFKLASSVARIEQLQSEGITSHRAGLDAISTHLEDSFEFPFGFGPGMSSGLMKAFRETQQKRWDRKLEDFWSMDNFYVFAILELGIGSIFYLLIFFAIPILLGKYIIKLKARGEENAIATMTPGFVTSIVAIIGGWAAVAIPFNPVSFFYWFYVSISIYEYYKMTLKYPELSFGFKDKEIAENPAL